jgi:hypothetical protein
MGCFRHALDRWTAAEDVDDRFVPPRLERMLELLRAQEELRFFVDGTRHFGHQASTVALLKRIVDRTGYAGRVRVVHTDSDKVRPGSTASKLALLLPGLDPDRIGDAVVGYGTCGDIRFVPYADRAMLGDEVLLGFTGGADEMSVNLAAELRVRYFLRLQPYLWDDGADNRSDPYYESSRIETPDGRLFYPVDENDAFRRLAYRVDRSVAGPVADAVWSWYGETQSFDAALRVRTNNARGVYRALRSRPELQLWPVYGLHHFAGQAAEMALNLVLTALTVRQEIRRPVVVAVLNMRTAVPGVLDLVLPLSRDLAGGDPGLGELRSALARMIPDGAPGEGPRTDGPLDAFVRRASGRVRRWLDAGSRLTVLETYDAAAGAYVDASDRLAEALGRAGDRDVLLALLGPVPVDVYHHFFTTCEIPGVFEGQGTSSAVLSLGQPFLQVPRVGNLIRNSYPTRIAGHDLGALAAEANDAALQIREQRCGAYVQPDATLDPVDFWAGLDRTAAFILAVRDPSSRMAGYFRRLGRYCSKDVHDKWLMGMLALSCLMDGDDDWRVEDGAPAAR